MPLGSTEYVVLCRPGGQANAACPSGTGEVAVQFYLVEPSSASQFEASAAPFDYLLAVDYWSVGFVFTVSLYLLVRGIGSVVRMVR